MNNDPAGGTLYLSISVCRGDMLLLYHPWSYTGAIMTLHEAVPTPDSRKIAEASERQHRINIDAELARRGLLEASGLTHLSHERTLDYIRDLEEQLEKAKNSKSTGNSL